MNIFSSFSEITLSNNISQFSRPICPYHRSLTPLSNYTPSIHVSQTSPPVIAFTVAYNQNKQLIGQRGLMPAKDYLNSVKRYVGGKIGMAALAYTPSILWFMDWSAIDANLDGIALVGMVLSGFVLVTGMANMVIMVVLWVLYHSLVSVGQLW